MARIPKADLDGLYGKLITVMTRRMFGKTPESIAVMWHHRRALKDTMSYGQKIEKWDALDKNLAAYATMAAAASIGCSFCLDFGYFMAHNKGLDETKARDVPRWRESAAFTPVERRSI